MGTDLLRMLMTICILGEAWKDPSQIPASEIVDVWREQASSGRFANSYIWGAEALLDARAQMEGSRCHKILKRCGGIGACVGRVSRIGAPPQPGDVDRGVGKPGERDLRGPSSVAQDQS